MNPWTTKLHCLALATICAVTIDAHLGHAQGTPPLGIPFINQESLSNVVISVPLSGFGVPCPPKYTNRLSNTNLFTPSQQRVIKDVFVKYLSVTTNSGPPGTVLVATYWTNLAMPAYMPKTLTNYFNTPVWVSVFQHTNSDAFERVMFNNGLSAHFENKLGNGYAVVLTRVGNGTLLTFGEVAKGAINGLSARFDDLEPQGSNWDYKLADFHNACLVEYKHYTNGMVIGNYFMWNPESGNLTFEADFQKPFDWNKHLHLPDLFQNGGTKIR